MIKSDVEFILKGWGSEAIFARSPLYAGKLLRFDRQNSKFSMHYHMKKTETWYILDGVFKLTVIDTTLAKEVSYVLKPGDTWTNPPGLPHRLECLSTGGNVIEVSTEDDPEDNYRILPGDSQ